MNASGARSGRLRDRPAILVLGMGPAGVAVACELHRLGHAPQVLGNPAGCGTEGLSERTLGLLRAAGLERAAAAAGAAVQRCGDWAGQTAARSAERILERARFDDALCRELSSRGLAVRPGRVLEVVARGAGWRIRSSDGASLEAALVVDARGRRAQRGGTRGPALLALGQAFRGVSAEPGTQILSSAEGWFWLAHDGARSWLQYVTRPGLARGAASMGALLERAVATEARVARWLAGATPASAVSARSATARLAGQAPRGWLRAGDAALALDPLCGHGIHEALRAAKVVAACAHTLLTAPDAPAEAAAGRFLREWTESLWERSLRTAAGFYGAEAARRPGPFWTASAAEYQRALTRLRPAAADAAAGIRIEQRPVLAGERIELRRVVVTAHHPRGIWQIDSVDILELREALRGRPRGALEGVARQFARPAAAIDNAAAWLVRHGMLAESERPVA